MAGALIRELRRKLPGEALGRHQERLDLYERVKDQKRSDKNKVYSLHEPDILCISKGKAHKQYEFGAGVHRGHKNYGYHRRRDVVQRERLRRPYVAGCPRTVLGGHRGLSVHGDLRPRLQGPESGR